MLSTSHRAPGYRFQYQVPPTSPPCSKTRTDSPSPRSRYSMYSPAKPAPTTTTSQVAVSAAWLLPEMDDEADIRTPSDFFGLKAAFYPPRESAREKKCRPETVLQSPARNYFTPILRGREDR